MENYKDMVNQIIDIGSLEKGEYLVRASFDPSLEEVKDQMDALEEKIEKQLDKVKEDLSLDSVKLEYVSHLRYHFRIPHRYFL